MKMGHKGTAHKDELLAGSKGHDRKGATLPRGSTVVVPHIDGAQERLGVLGRHNPMLPKGKDKIREGNNKEGSPYAKSKKK